MSVKRFRNTATGFLATMALTMTAFVGLSSAAQAGPDRPPAPDRGCPYGAVCVYPDDSWNGGNPTYVFYSYGTHQIYNQYGDHRVYNNQYGGAYAAFSNFSDGSRVGRSVQPGEWDTVNLTTINSIVLYPSAY